MAIRPHPTSAKRSIWRKNSQSVHPEGRRVLTHQPVSVCSFRFSVNEPRQDARHPQLLGRHSRLAPKRILAPWGTRDFPALIGGAAHRCHEFDRQTPINELVVADVSPSRPSRCTTGPILNPLEDIEKETVEIELHAPVRIVVLEFGQVADIPNVVAATILFNVVPLTSVRFATDVSDTNQVFPRS